MSVPLAPALRPASVLVIEDNPDVAESLARFLRVAFGHRVEVATDGLRGVRKALAVRPDVVVCDIGLPKQNGLLVAEEIVLSLPRKPLLIALTGHGDRATRELAADIGFDHFLTKPADPFRIEDLIEARLRGRASEAWE